MIFKVQYQSIVGHWDLGNYISETNKTEDSSSLVSKNASIKPTVSLLDVVPPPVDCDDWDTKSDSLSDQEDLLSYQEEENLTRSSVFDNEPPSLTQNESSGIVKDFNNTR